MLPFIKVTVALVVASTIVVCAQDKSSTKTDSHPAAYTTTAHHDVDSTTKPVEKAALVPQTTCPVQGDPINKKLYVDYQGKRIYVCCAECKSALAKDPEMYIKKLESMGQSVEIIDSVKAREASAGASNSQTVQNPAVKLIPQKTCPVMGSPIDKSVFVDYKGKRVYFCCGMCPATFKQDPEKYLKILADKGEAVEEIGKK